MSRTGVIGLLGEPDLVTVHPVRGTPYFVSRRGDELVCSWYVQDGGLREGTYLGPIEGPYEYDFGELLRTEFRYRTRGLRVDFTPGGEATRVIGRRLYGGREVVVSGDSLEEALGAWGEPEVREALGSGSALVYHLDGLRLAVTIVAGFWSPQVESVTLSSGGPLGLAVEGRASP